MDQVTLARTIATVAHAGQVDKGGVPYIEHPRRVAERVQQETSFPLTIATAWLHDVLEDTKVSPAMLWELGVDHVVIGAVRALSRIDGEDYDDAVRRAAAHPIGRVVKTADVADNSDEDRLVYLDSATADRLRRKYQRAKALLEGD